jgi:hypothetical protein
MLNFAIAVFDTIMRFMANGLYIFHFVVMSAHVSTVQYFKDKYSKKKYN